MRCFVYCRECWAAHAGLVTVGLPASARWFSSGMLGSTSGFGYCGAAGLLRGEWNCRSDGSIGLQELPSPSRRGLWALQDSFLKKEGFMIGQREHGFALQGRDPLFVLCAYVQHPARSGPRCTHSTNESLLEKATDLPLLPWD